MRISDWSSDVCSSDLLAAAAERPHAVPHRPRFTQRQEGQHCMAKTPHLDTIRLELAKLESRLAAIIEREKEAEALQRNAGRSAPLAALDRVEVRATDHSNATSIDTAIGTRPEKRRDGKEGVSKGRSRGSRYA